MKLLADKMDIEILFALVGFFMYLAVMASIFIL